MGDSARARHMEWKQPPEVEAARNALLRLFSYGHVYIFRHKLTPGEGYVSDNRLHNRSGFEIAETGGTPRVRLSTRDLDRVCRRSGLGAWPNGGRATTDRQTNNSRIKAGD